MGHIGVRELASRVLVTTSGDVCLLSQRCLATKRYAEPDFCRHDALYVHRDCLHGLHVHLAGHDIVATKVPLRSLMSGSFTKRKSALHGALFLCLPLKRTKQPVLGAHYWSYLRQS